MIKINNILLMAVAVMMTAACAKMQSENDGELATLDFEIGIPEAMTKTMGDGKTVNTLVCAVFEDGMEISALRQQIAIEAGTVKANYRPALYIGRTYKLVFWAHYVDSDGNPFYNVDDLSAIETNIIKANADYADAFYAAADVEFTAADQKGTATLERPMSKLNIAVPSEYWNDDAAYVEVTLEASKSFNCLTGEESAETETITFVTTVGGPEDVYTVTVKDPDTQVETTTEYRYLAYNYFFPSPLTSVNIKVYDNAPAENGEFSDDDLIIEIDRANTPVQENSQTHLLGDIFRANLDFDFTFVTGFTGSDNKVTVE